MIRYLGSALDPLVDLQRALDSLSGADWFGTSTISRRAYPPVNIFQEGEDYVVVTEIPGVHKDDLDISIKRNQLRISGHKNLIYGDNVSIHRQERSRGAFDRTIDLRVEIDPDKAKAQYRDGVLAIHLPRADADKPRSVQIK